VFLLNIFYTQISETKRLTEDMLGNMVKLSEKNKEFSYIYAIWNENKPFSYIYDIINCFFLLFNRKLTLKPTKLVGLRV